MKRFFSYVGLVSLISLGLAAGWVPLPYYARSGSPREVLPQIQVQGRQTYETGRLIWMTVAFRPVTAVGALVAWLDPEEAVVPKATLYPPGTSPVAEEQRAISQMDTSKIDATVVVLKELTDYPEVHGEGVLIQGVGPGCPAEGKLYPGDVISAIDGEPVGDLKEVSRAIGAVAPGTPIDFQIEAAGVTHHVDVARGTCPGVDRPLVGISSVNNFPFTVNIASGDVGGPSAGLMFSLGLYDLLTPGDLTGGRLVAGTGTIIRDGTVGPIGGITDKIVAARDAGASVFLCPKDNLAEAGTVDAGEMKIVPVASFAEALSFLQPGS